MNRGHGSNFRARGGVVAHIELEGLESLPFAFKQEFAKVEGAIKSIPDRVEKAVGDAVNSLKSAANKIGENLKMNLPDVYTIGDSPTPTSGTNPPKGNKGMWLDMPFLELFTMGTGQKRLEPSKPSMDRKGKTGGEDLKSIGKDANKDQDLQSLDAFRDDANESETNTVFQCAGCTQIFKDSAGMIVPTKDKVNDDTKNRFHIDGSKPKNQ